MPVEEHLMPGEVVLASAGTFYATDRRLLRYDPAPATGSFTESLEYLQIQSVRPGIQTRYRLIILSFAALMLGLIDPIRLQPKAPFFTLVMAVGGLIGLVYGILNRKTVWNIISAQVAKSAQSRWRVQDDSNERSRRFLQVVQARMGKPVQIPEPETPAALGDAPASTPPDEQQR